VQSNVGDVDQDLIGSMSSGPLMRRPAAPPFNAAKANAVMIDESRNELPWEASTETTSLPSTERIASQMGSFILVLLS
jgi:hypothetical protein